MSKTVEQVVAAANESHIASIQTILGRIVEVLQSPKSNAMDLKNLIELDPPLAARVLRRAHSAYYGMNRPIVDVMDAIICIGFDAVKELALNQKVCQLFLEESSLADYSRPKLWTHCVGVALCGKLIYRKEFRLPGDDIYTLGLLHDIGILVEDQFLRREFIRIQDRMIRQKQSLLDAEREVLGYCHEDIGRGLLESWNFPEPLAKLLGCAERPWLSEAEHSVMASTLYVANCVCYGRKIGYVEVPLAEQAHFRECCQRLNIKELALKIIVDEVELQMNRMGEEGWF